MAKQKDLEKQIEFIRLLKANQLTTPNDFTIGMGDLIRQAREDKGFSQADLAKALNRRQGTISDIENGKSEIGILTLVQFAVELEKPISYFFPNSLLREWIVDVKSPFQYKILEIASNLEQVGDPELALDLLGILQDYFFKQRDLAEHPENYFQEPEDE